jgi:putative transposase
MSDQIPTTFDWSHASIEHRDNLPHVRQDNVIYFLTFRLADSLPQEKVAELKQNRAQWMHLNPPPHTPEQQQEYRRIWTVRIENLMDAGYGKCVLRDPECRAMLEATMRYDDAVRYRLGEFVIMPNHVHALLHVLPNQDLSEIVKAWKSISARRIGRRLGQLGSYWMDEYFDHAVRADEALERFVSYIRQNPNHLTATDFTLARGTLAT